MNQVTVRKEDQILMSLVHYFVTEKNYAPIYVHGVKDEIWLENVDGPYRVIRINSNRIFNEEQFNFDLAKINDILRQVKKKTFTFKINALNINLNEEEGIEKKELKNVDNISINSFDEIKTNKLLKEVFPDMDGNIYDENVGLDLIFNVTRDINAKTEKDNKRYEKIFKSKKPIITIGLIVFCILVFLLNIIIPNISLLFCNHFVFVKAGEVYRLITYMFLHDTSSIFHILCNMYSLYIIGSEMESRYGKLRFLLIFLISGVAGALLSCSFRGISIGASGAIFGLLGAYVYFALRFRLVFQDALKNQIIPVILLNLFLGFIFTGIDNACHIGGLIAGFLSAMAFGIPNDKKKSDELNGKILLSIFIIFLAYLVFFR